MVFSSAVSSVLARAANPDKPIRVGRNKEYPRQLWWLIASFIALVSLSHFLSVAVAKCSRRRTDGGTTSRPGNTRSSSDHRLSWRRLPLALVNAFRVVAFRWTLPVGQWQSLTFAEVFIVCAYIVALFTWAFVDTTTLAGAKLNVMYWENRAGVLGASQLPLIVALGTKNNAISYLTGVSYDRLKFIHRMIARTIFILLWVHGSARIANLDPSQYVNWFVPLGITAMSAFSLLLIVSLRPIRARAYELFYYIHVLTVLVILLAAYFHTDNMGFGFYLWPCFIIWGLDRAVRLGRLIYYNHLYFGFGSASQRLDASVELLSPHMVRLHLKRPPHFRWTPGQTAFLAMPTVSRLIVESHPFTIASVDSRYALGDEVASHDTDKGAFDKDADHETTAYWNELVFLIHVREGYTKRLANAAAKGDKVKVLVDGPYGFSPDLDNDDTVVLVAGGSGVSFTLSTFLGTLSRIKSGKCRCRKIVFIWAIREAEHMEWISKVLVKALSLAPADIDISVRIFITARSGQSLANATSLDDDKESAHSSEGTAPSKSRPPSLLNFPVVQVAHGRPDLPSLLREEVEANTGRLSVTVCGSSGIAQSCREALRIPMAIVLKGGPSVVLHVESFGYA
ncbi:iron reductase [Trametes coccinea BRFM310]|uniref:ferric-chelate reductase (NADPH) n=1 Tax=Trametes coccinea (strain BRFM310) TaxID=1353009 RepID=A0A1Y2ICJ9_TRAC3|nr:iron reductase [Trametes coccinea BRFM310]